MVVSIFLLMEHQHRSEKSLQGLDLKITKPVKRRKFQLILVFFILSLFYFWPLRTVIMLHYSENNNGNNKIKVNGIFDKKAPVFITTICEGEVKKTNLTNSLATNLNRQIQQTVIMLKSAAVLSTSFVNFIIVVDHDSLYDKIIEEVERWPEDILRKISLQQRYVYFPEGSVFKTLFRLCTSARLFFAERMTDIESAIYVDTDMLFMRPPHELWREFRLFNSTQMCGIATIEYYNPNIKIPYYGSSGLNGGLWMMNMTRMRNYPGGWEKRCHDIYQQYKNDIVYADQDIANIIFSKEPQYLYPVGCHWNFRSFLCQTGINVCDESRIKGTFLLHGNDMKFFKDDDMKMKTMYEVWKNFQPGRSLSDLLTTFKMSLITVEEKTSSKYCSQVDGIDRVLTKGLEDHILSFK